MKQAATLLSPLLLLLAPLLTLNSAESQSHLELRTQENRPLLGEKHPIPDSSLYQILAAELALDREHPEIALTNYIAAAQETQDGSIAARATQIALSVSSLEVAIEPALIWAKAEPNNLEAQITAAALYLRMDQVPNSIPLLRQAEVANPDEALQYYLILYRQLQKEEDNRRVVQALKLLAKEETKNASAHLALAEIYLYLGQTSLGLKMSKSALEIAPDSVTAMQLYSESLFRTQGKVAAKDFVQHQITLHPHNLLLREYYAQFLLENGFTDLAKKEIENLIKNPHLTAEELLNFARLCMQAQWFTLAQEVLHRASEFTDSKDLSHYFLARLCEMQNQDEAAINWFKQVLTGQFHVLSQIRASTLLTEQKRYDEALEVLSHTQPNDIADKKQILLSSVNVLNKAQRYQEAFELLNAHINLMPDDIELLYARSIIADKLEKTDLAIADLKAIINADPHHLEALNALGYILVTKTKQYQEAERFLSRALEISPNNASVLDSIGWLYYKIGNYPKSLEILQKAAKIMPNAEIAAHLGAVMWQMNDFEGAKKVWNNALEQHPKHEHILKVRQKMMSSQQPKHPF